MLPAQRNKVDISKLTPQEQQLFAKYGKLPTHKNILMKMQKERKYFDSGDYALSKAGVTPQSTVGTAIPNPENIPHASNPGISNGHQIPSSVSPTTSTSPVNRESGLAHIMNTKPPEAEAEEEEDDDDDDSEPEKDEPKQPGSSSAMVTSTTVETSTGTVQEMSVDDMEIEKINTSV
ncbi:Endosulfine-domain-containing protein [Macrolepiota fuliginosa MF-IS2]|uniref:mRNA stability protein n=1 Tax=Macrolepiota fuliginosa MF-IS2 TaxID=1400762 RepID=A0A9P6C786_9AGAR|nr:Endosulfine-domain-containing protein [Macrolepiota fuliginosa MF-IS2]